MASGDTSQVKYALGNDADDGDYTTTLVAAVAGRKIRVLSLGVTVLTTAGVFSLKSGATVIFAHHLVAGTPLVAGYTPVGLCETAAGEALVASNGTGVDSYVTVAYVEVEA